MTEFWFVSLCMFMFSFASDAVAGDPMAPLLRCKRRLVTQLPASGAAVALRAYPIGFETIDLPPAGLSLGELLSVNAGHAMAIEMGRENAKPRSKDGRGQPINRNCRFPLIYGPDTTADAILISRGREMTVFPRLLLQHPRVSLARIESQDIVATLFATPAKQEARHDNLHELAFGKYQSSATRPWVAQGALFEPTRWKNFLLLSSSGNVSMTFDTFRNLYESRLRDPVEQKDAGEKTDSLKERMPVYVIARRRQGQIFRYIIPWKNAGLFGSSGKLFRSLFQNPIADEKGNWDSAMSSFTNLRLVPGDVIEVTYLEFVPFFQSIVN